MVNLLQKKLVSDANEQFQGRFIICQEESTSLS